MMGRPARPAGPYNVWHKRAPASARVSVEDRMVTALRRHIVDLSDLDAVAALLRRAGFDPTDIARHAGQAAATAKARAGRR